MSEDEAIQDLDACGIAADGDEDRATWLENLMSNMLIGETGSHAETYRHHGRMVARACEIKTDQADAWEHLSIARQDAICARWEAAQPDRPLLPPLQGTPDGHTLR